MLIGYLHADVTQITFLLEKLATKLLIPERSSKILSQPQKNHFHMITQFRA